VSPITHGLLSWLLANTGKLERRDRAFVTIAGIVPDIDGLGAIAEVATKNSAHPLLWFSDYHHFLCHNVYAAFFYAAIVAVFARRRWMCVALALAAFHLHLLCDVIGARGPDGHQWPIWYFSPFSLAWPLTWSAQWRLDSWINQLITVIALLVTCVLAWRRGYSPLEMLSLRADAAFIGVLRQRFGRS
jgi:inner membrane protein